MRAVDTSNCARLLIESFPNLSSEDFEFVGACTEQYNCIAYAAGDTTKWWSPSWPYYWPPWATRDNRMESLMEAFAGLGYEQCDDSNVEDGYQKVVLYGFQGSFEHAAVQMPNGRWHSKMGQGPQIEHHSPESLSGGPYGDAMIYVRRSADPTD